MVMIMTDMKHRNEGVVVTGAASGIGKAIADIYFSDGYEVIGLDVVQADTGYPIIACDVSDESAVSAAFDLISERVSAIRYLINCAGIFFSARREPIDMISLEEWNNTYRNNATSVMLVTKYAIPLLKACRGDKAIINISSDQVKFPRPKNVSYSVSKSAIENFSRACAVEFLEDKIRVNVVEAASVRTNFIHKLSGTAERENEIYNRENKKMPLGLIEAEDVAQMVCFLGSVKAKRITGQVILIDSGLYI